MMPHSTTLRLIAIISISFSLTACVGQNATSKQNSEIGVVLGSTNSGSNNNAVNTEPVVQGISGTSAIPTISNSDPESASESVSSDVLEDTELTLTWQADNEALEGYQIYYGSSPATATRELSDIKAFSGSFDFLAPSIQYASWSDLGLQPGNTVCFKVRAYNADGMSDWSAVVCGVIPQKSA